MENFGLNIFISDVAIRVKGESLDMLESTLKSLKLPNFEIERWATRRGFLVYFSSDKETLMKVKGKIYNHYSFGNVGA